MARVIFVCDGCGKRAAGAFQTTGLAVRPEGWHQRLNESGLHIACSRECLENDVITADLRKAQAKCAALGLHPKDAPLEPDHHTDVPLSEADKKIGDALAWFLGGLFVDVEDDPLYWRNNMTSADVWRRVARALRIHGLRIVDAPT